MTACLSNQMFLPPSTLQHNERLRLEAQRLRTMDKDWAARVIQVGAFVQAAVPQHWSAPACRVWTGGTEGGRRRGLRAWPRALPGCVCHCAARGTRKALGRFTHACTLAACSAAVSAHQVVCVLRVRAVLASASQRGVRHSQPRTQPAAPASVLPRAMLSHRAVRPYRHSTWSKVIRCMLNSLVPVPHHRPAQFHWHQYKQRKREARRRANRNKNQWMVSLRARRSITGGEAEGEGEADSDGDSDGEGEGVEGGEEGAAPRGSRASRWRKKFGGGQGAAGGNAGRSEGAKGRPDGLGLLVLMPHCVGRGSWAGGGCRQGRALWTLRCGARAPGRVTANVT